MAGIRNSRSFDAKGFASKLSEAKANLHGSPGATRATTETEDPAVAGQSWFAKLGGALPSVSAAAANIGGLAGIAAAAQKGVQGVASVTGQAQGLVRSASTTISENAISRQQWMTFFGGAMLGAFLVGLSLMFLPMLVFAPQKFAVLFTLGSLCFMSSFSVLRGHAAFVRHLLSRSRALFTATYTTSMAGTLWASLMYRSYLLTLAFSGVQVVAMAWFLVSYIPGGRRALGLVTGIAWRLARTCCRCASKGSLLPF